MKILAIGDMHGKVEALRRVGEDVGLWKPDLVVFCGDILAGPDEGEGGIPPGGGGAPEGGPSAAESSGRRGLFRLFMETISGFQGEVRVVPGHTDFPYSLFLESMLSRRKRFPHVLPVHHNLSPAGRDFILLGFGGFVHGGEIHDETSLVFPYWEVEYWLETAKLFPQKTLLLTHVPPRAERIDVVDKSHVGSSHLRALIEELQPVYAFCGHAHCAQGMEEIGSTPVINPGALVHGGYAIVNTRKETVRFDTVEVS
jgi:Icc-related predicted phosphoesterase